MNNVQTNQECENLLNVNIQILCSYLEFKKICRRRKKASKKRILLLKQMQLKNKVVIEKILSRNPAYRSCWMKPELCLTTHGTYWEVTVPVLNGKYLLIIIIIESICN